MLSKNEIKYIQSLCHKKHRDEERLFIAEGPKMAEELLKSDFEINHIYAVKEWMERHDRLIKDVTEVSDSELEKISNLQTANQVVIIAKQKQDVEISVANKLTIVLDAIQDPGNFGTVVRIADWFGIEQIVASENSVELYNPKVVQATMGSICRVTVVYKELLEWIKDVEIPKYGALLHGANVYTIKNIKEGLIVIGNESRGISEPLRSLITDPVTIPKAGGAESLNAAVAAGIIVGSLVNS